MTETTTAPAEQTALDLPDAMTRRVTVVRATREKLITDAHDHLDRRHEHFKTFHGVKEHTPLTDAALDAYAGLVHAGTSAYLIAAMLRVVEAKDPALALELAEMADYVDDAGIEAIEDANDDLDQRVREGAAR